jgi:hypothetical protein
MTVCSTQASLKSLKDRGQNTFSHSPLPSICLQNTQMKNEKLLEKIRQEGAMLFLPHTSFYNLLSGFASVV